MRVSSSGQHRPTHFCASLNMPYRVQSLILLEKVTEKILRDSTMNAVQKILCDNEPCYVCDNQRKFDRGETSEANFLDYANDHQCKCDPTAYEKERLETAISILNPLHILEQCVHTSNNVSWCITALKSKLADPIWFKRMYSQCCRKLTLA